MVWEELLGISGIGNEDEFFELGGHSPMFTQVLTHIDEIFGAPPCVMSWMSRQSGTSRSLSTWRSKALHSMEALWGAKLRSLICWDRGYRSPPEAWPHATETSRMAEPFLLRLLNAAFFRASRGTQRPAMFDIDATFPALRLLDRHCEEIRGELEPLLSERYKLPRYHEIDRIQADISGDAPGAWRVFMLKWPAGGVEANRNRCPRTAALLDQIPNVASAFFSILEPGKSVPAHDGPYLGLLRYHLALKVPSINPPSIRIKDLVHTWVEGHSILFDDSWNHEVFNRADEVRVVLIVDVLRPMAWPHHLLNWGVLRLLGPISDEARAAAANIRKYG